MTDKVHQGSFFTRLIPHVPFGQFGRYLIAGVGNTIFAYGSFVVLTAVLTPLMPHAYLIAGFVASLLNITFAYLNYKWFVFKTKGNYLREWSRCVVVYSGGIIAGLTLLPIIVFIIRHNTRFDAAAPYIAGALLTGVHVIVSFLGHKKFSFRPAD